MAWSSLSSSNLNDLSSYSFTNQWESFHHDITKDAFELLNLSYLCWMLMDE